MKNNLFSYFKFYSNSNKLFLLFIPTLLATITTGSESSYELLN